MKKIFKIVSDQSGFTLLELLVVVAVIAFLSSVSIVALSRSQLSARDSQRKLDQISIIKAADLYINDFGVAPSSFEVETMGEPFFQLAAMPKSSEHIVNRLFSVESAQAQLGNGGESCTWLNDNGCGTDLDCPDGCSCSVNMPESCVGQCYEDGFGDLCPGGGSGGGPYCGDGVVNQVSEECDDGNAQDGDGCDSLCQIEPPPGCDDDSICEPQFNENVVNCPNDCFSGGGGPVSCTVDGVCSAGETPGNCSEDCTNSSMCYADGEWDLCCLFGGTYCPAGGQPGPYTGGYFGVCNGAVCEQRYLLQPPSFTCANDSDCTPNLGDCSLQPDPAQCLQDKMVSDDGSTYLRALIPYMVTLPQDPGHHQTHPQCTPEILNQYWVSTHVDVVKEHRFCVWVSLEDLAQNVNPYTDLPDNPCGSGLGSSDIFRVLCTD